MRSSLIQKVFFLVFCAFFAIGFQKSGTVDVKQSPFLGEVTITKLNVRALPELSKESTIVGIVYSGSNVKVVGEEGKFYKILPPASSNVWVYQSNVAEDGNSAKTLKVITDDAPLRVDSRSNALKVATVSKGDVLAFKKKYLGWYQVTPPDSVKFFVAKKYVKKIKDLEGVANVMFDSKQSKKAACTATLQQAEVIIKKQQELIKQNKIKDVTFDGVIKSYEDAAVYCDDASTKKFAEDSARRYKQIQGILVGVQINFSALESQSGKVKELLDMLEKTRTKKSYSCIGTLDTVGLISNRPSEFKIWEDDGRFKFLKIREDDKENYNKAYSLFKKKVGIVGAVSFDENWPNSPIIIADSIDWIDDKDSADESAPEALDVEPAQ